MWYTPGMTAISLARRRAWQQRGGRNSRRNLPPAVRTHLARKAAAARWKRTPKAARADAARKAVQARWARVRAHQE